MDKLVGRFRRDCSAAPQIESTGGCRWCRGRGCRRRRALDGCSSNRAGHVQERSRGRTKGGPAWFASSRHDRPGQSRETVRRRGAMLLARDDEEDAEIMLPTPSSRLRARQAALMAAVTVLFIGAAVQAFARLQVEDFRTSPTSRDRHNAVPGQARKKSKSRSRFRSSSGTERAAPKAACSRTRSSACVPI